MRGIWRRARILVVGCGIAAVALAAAPAAHGEPAVVLVSGFDTSTPFSTPDPSCAGQEGLTWSNPDGPAAALRAAGFSVFTAPVARGGALPPSPCLGPGQPAPPNDATIDSNGELDANGRALDTLLGFLRTEYGVDSVQLVAHSDGGLWSRSAITQGPGSATALPTVQSLTTLGTPHTGSFGADLAETLQDGQCHEANRIEQVICEAVLDILKDVFGSLGEATIKELSHPFLAAWNPRQEIGCPVTVIGGTAVDIPLVPSLFDYYNPSDGIVGEASALAERSTSIALQPIPAPGFQAIGRQTFPVVHSGVLSFITPNTLLNQADISADVVAAVRAGTSRPSCSAWAETASAEAAPIRTRVGFRSIDVPRDGWLPRPRRGDALLLTRGTSLRCRGATVTSVPVLGSRRLSVAMPRCRTRLRAVGRGRVLDLRASPRRGLVIRRGARSIDVRTTGPKLRRVRARVLLRGRWHRLPLAQGRRLPATARGRGVSVRVIGLDPRGERLVATAHVAPATAR
ncbi:MAG: hypothetical protein GEU88_14360 [Solirubrobacterales bacterium]|nr:hypothetical protein [Solirubrobacterales bacterium]